MEDPSLIEKKLALISSAELTEAIREDLLSNGLEETDIDPLESMSEERLRDNLVRLYRGEGLHIDQGLRLTQCSALFPGKLLGISPCWARLPVYEEELACEESVASLPGCDFRRSYLLGMTLVDNVFDDRLLDLSELPQLLGLLE